MEHKNDLILDQFGRYRGVRFVGETKRVGQRQRR